MPARSNAPTLAATWAGSRTISSARGRISSLKSQRSRTVSGSGAERLAARGVDPHAAHRVAEVRLDGLGVAGLSIDLNLPPLVADTAAALGFDAAAAGALRQALDRKDAAAVEVLAGDQAPLAFR